MRPEQERKWPYVFSSGSLGALLRRLRQFAMEPGPGERPIAADCTLRDLKSFGDLLVTQSTEESQLHNLTLAGIQHSKSLQRIIECDEIFIRLHGDGQSLVERHAPFFAPGFQAGAIARE